MKRLASKSFKIVLSFIIAISIALITTIITTTQEYAGKTLTQYEAAQYFFKFVVVYALIGGIVYLILTKTKLKRAFGVVLISTLIFGSLAAMAIVIYDTSSLVRQSTSDVAKSCTVTVLVDGGHGTGFSIKQNQVLTNNHVIQNTSNIRVWYGREVPARVIKASPNEDLALLEVDNVMIPVCSLADSNLITSGQDLFAVGWPNNPYGEATVTRGIYSRRITANDSATMGITGTELIQSDASMNPGNSGGPVVNDKGIIGMVVAKAVGSEGLGYAIPSNYIAEFIK